MKSLATLPLLALALLASGCGGGEAKNPAGFERPPAVVTATAAIVSDVPNYLDEIGRTWAREVVQVQPQVSGKITAIHFVDGADVKKGDLLFTIDERSYRAQADLAAGNLAQSRAALDLARVELARADELLKTKAGSRQDYDSKKGAVAVAEARVQSDEAALELANVNLEYCSIRSPIDGRAGQRLVDLGNVVAGMSGTPLLTVQRLDPIYADFTVTERELALVQKSMSAGRLKVEVQLAEEDPHVREGELTFLDTAVQDGTGTIKLRATVPNADRFLWPGQFLRVRLILGMHAKAVLVPSRARQISQKGPFVFVVTKDKKVEQRAVTPGQRHGDLVVVDEGLSAGEDVVVTGQLMLFPGAPVVVKETSAP
jgi:multidrug efflux system membrane fusion protein